MQLNIYASPEISFVGGSTQIIRFNLHTSSGQAFNATGCDVYFSIVPYTNKNGTATLSKTATLKEDSNNILSIAEIELVPDDTKSLYGQYIYQITIVDIDENVDIPSQGILLITKNINPTVLS